MAVNEPVPPPNRENLLIAELLGELKTQGWSAEDLDRVEKAYQFAKRFHTGQLRKNGENYITHPVEVAQILATVKADCPTLMAALMHDVLEDTQATPEEMGAAFGPEVLRLVEAVTKLGRYRFSSKEEQQAESFRKMFLAMAEDIRVITLKLADRLHNMRTLYHLKPEKQQKIAAETLDIFAPLANRMGMGNFRAELEDLALKYLDGPAYQTIEKELSDSKTEREATMACVVEKIEAHLAEGGYRQARIYGRLKNYYSIYKKMASQQKDLNAIFDISALRIIVETERECYEVLGLIHSAFTPVAGRFKDYIAMPKSNFYQSLHTTIIGPRLQDVAAQEGSSAEASGGLLHHPQKGRPIEVQIRTQRMHELAEYGIAAHFKYKEAGASVAASSQDDQKLAWLKQVLELKTESNSAQEFVENVKIDLFPDQVFVFTPKGEVVNLPKGSTPVDFAFRIHTQVGNHCSGAIVNERIVPLDTELSNGDIVEVITNKKANPRLDWINFVQTQHAKARIRQWHKKHYREQHEQQGKHLLEAELTRAAVDTMSKNGRLLEVAKELNLLSVDDLYAALGYGEMTIPRVLNRLRKQQDDAQEALEKAQKAASGEELESSKPTWEAVQQSRKLEEARKTPVVGLKGLLYHIAQCCAPVPGDPIMGIVTRSRGVMIHREDCTNTVQANPARLMNLSWDGPVEMRNSVHAVTLEVHVLDRIGIFKDVLSQVSDNNINITTAKCRRNEDGQSVYIEMTLEIRNLGELEKVTEQIKALGDVVAMKRQHYRLNK